MPLVLAVLTAAAIPAALKGHTLASIGAISVAAGVPHELSFTVSPSRITFPTDVFKVTNKGKLPHSFKICTKPSTNDKANSCVGVATKTLAPGKTASLTVKLPVSGKYEYLSGSASQAASGMKGLVTVTLAPSSSTSSGSPATTTTAKSGGSSGGGPSGGVVNGQATDPQCPEGTLVPVGPGAGDQDDDNEGGFATDGDGCL
jgi:plastocyanin